MKIKINSIHGPRFIGEDYVPYIIAEAGINHNGNIEIAKQLIYEASKAGADAIKFQKRTIEEMFTHEHLNKPYNKDYAFGKTYGEHKKALEFSDEQYLELYKYAQSLKIDFLCSGFDFTSFRFIEHVLNVPIHKIASPFVTHYPLLKEIAGYGKPMILSTGMHNMDEIERSVNYIRQFNDQIVVLQATTLYPCPDEEVNLRVLDTFKQKLHTLVGYSSHDKGVIIPAVSVAFGACIIEKHFTLDRMMTGPDHIASVEPRGLELICKYAKSAHKGLGVPEKYIHESELSQREKYGVSVVSLHPIHKGQKITAADITVKCPGGGLSPEIYDTLPGMTAQRDIEADSIIYNGDLA